ncbi:hypothetical protein VIBNIAM115_830039 [Vibrio nigripulchritudo AM115]|nr:hypothetical protein VIBNIAM115_830039 [Vibrio nigripulchritudo AM115]
MSGKILAETISLYGIPKLPQKCPRTHGFENWFSHLIDYPKSQRLEYTVARIESD